MRRGLRGLHDRLIPRRQSTSCDDVFDGHSKAHLFNPICSTRECLHVYSQLDNKKEKAENTVADSLLSNLLIPIDLGTMPSTTTPYPSAATIEGIFHYRTLPRHADKFEQYVCDTADIHVCLS